MPPPKNVPMASVAQVCSGTPRVLINVFPQAKYTVSLSVAFHYCTATIHLLFHVLRGSSLFFSLWVEKTPIAPLLLWFHMRGSYFECSLCPARG